MTDADSKPQATGGGDDAATAKKPCCDAAVQAALDRLQLEHAEMQMWRLESRERFAKSAFTLLRITLVVLLALVLLDGFGAKWFEIDSTVLVTLVTGVAANVFAMVVLVMKFVYAPPTGGWLGDRK